MGKPIKASILIDDVNEEFLTEFNGKRQMNVDIFINKNANSNGQNVVIQQYFRNEDGSYDKNVVGYGKSF